MLQEVLTELRSVSENFKNCILRSVEVYRARRLVIVAIITDAAFTPSDKTEAQAAIKKFVPAYFDCTLEITKLTPDCDMVKRKIFDAVGVLSKAVFSTLSADDITVEKREDGFHYSIAVAPSFVDDGLCVRITEYLKKNYYQVQL